MVLSKNHLRQYLRQCQEKVELNVLLTLHENPRTSITEIANNIGSSKRTVNDILKKHKYKPYIPQKVHALEENDQVSEPVLKRRAGLSIHKW
ncbi:hypothetical protein NQ318_004740 [Aromia moschata]|uniref:Transposase n=1 Tax=Aromia moschata TaxID=1265417 RepID=A0AAV8XE62_9CUCU|nr:hypothetical protein NQ318_004740 [Aromia moschata]